jgi:hypothetical protein
MTIRIGADRGGGRRGRRFFLDNHDAANHACRNTEKGSMSLQA